MKKDLIYSITCLCYSIMIGGAVYEHLTMVPQWSAAPPVSLSMFQGTYGLKPEFFWMLIHPINLVLFVTSLIMHRRTERKKSILPTLITYAVILVITSIYFVPELLEITGTSFSTTADITLTKRAKLWEQLSLIRLAVLLVSATLLFLGLTRSKENIVTKKKAARPAYA